MDGKKRTRSQTTLDAFLSPSLDRSPLKQAKSALKLLPAPPAPPPLPPSSSSDAPSLAPHDPRLKRPPSPAKDAALFHERDPKRPRHDHSLFPRPPSASLSIFPSDHPPSSASRRAVSVPPISSALPLLDLNNLPPSPRRSPSKFRISSVPPERSPSRPERPKLLIPQPSSPRPSPPPLPSLDLAPPSLEPSTSPLTPLSPLSHNEHDEPMPVDPPSLPSTSTAIPQPAPSTSTSTSNSDSKPSRLPQPSVVSRMKPKQPSLPKKTRAPKASKNTAPIVRATRSTTLRQLKVEEEARTKAHPSAGPSATPLRRRSMSLSYAQPTAASAAKTSPVKPVSSRPSTGVPSTAFTFTAAVTPRVTHVAAPSSSSRPPLLQPPKEEARPAPAPAPVQLNSSLSTLNMALERLNAPPPSRPSTSMGFHRDADAPGHDQDESAALGSSTGAGGRPETALGVPLSGAGKTKGKGKAPLGSSTPGQGAGTGKMLRQTTLTLPPPLPAPNKARSGSMPPVRDRPVLANGEVDRRSAEEVAGAGEAEGDDKKKRQVSLALAPSLGKVRGNLGLGFAVPPGGASGPGTAPSTTTVARPTPTATPVSGPRTSLGGPKRIFPASTPSTGRAIFTGLGRGSGTGAGSGIAKPGAARSSVGVARPGLGPGAGPSGLRNGAVGGLGARRGLGIGAGRGLGLGGRVVHRVSKKSSLPVVIGSPVKGGGAGAVEVGEQEDNMMLEPLDLGEGPSGVVRDAGGTAGADMIEEGEHEKSTKDRIGEWLRNASEDVLRDLGHLEDTVDGGVATSASDQEGATSNADGGSSSTPDGTHPAPNGSAIGDKDKDKERDRERRRNESRRASMASHLLTQSLSGLPNTPPARMDGGAKGKGRAVSSLWPTSGAAEARSGHGEGEKGKAEGKGKERADGEMLPPPVPPPRTTRAHNTRLATGALSTPPEKTKAKEKGKEKGKAREGASESPGALAVLRGCTIFVDIRSEEGEDAGSLFVDMLRGLGAKMASRVGSRCTHVVYKNGLMSTIKGYRLLKEPKPLVVGIAWVVECAEQRRRVDEGKFLINLELANVAGLNKRRRSMIPKLLASPERGVKTGGFPSPASSDSSLRTNTTGFNGTTGYARSSLGDRSTEISSPTSMTVDGDGDSSMQSNSDLPPTLASGRGSDDEESLPPLEKARRRRSMLPTH